MRTMILAAAAAVSLGIGSAYAESEGGSGYAYPNFWGTQSVQQAPSSVAAGQNAPSAGAYVAHANRGTWLFAPRDGGGANN